MNRLSHLSYTSIFVCLVLVLNGCESGQPVGYVSGKVTVPSGEDPAGLLLRFVDGASGSGATAVVEQGGTYTLKHKGAAGVPVGAYTISVTAYVPQMTDKERTEFLALPADEQRQISEQRNAKKKLIPKKYHNQKTSNLSYKIVSGSQKHDIVIGDGVTSAEEVE